MISVAQRKFCNQRGSKDMEIEMSSKGKAVPHLYLTPSQRCHQGSPSPGPSCQPATLFASRLATTSLVIAIALLCGERGQVSLFDGVVLIPAESLVLTRIGDPNSNNSGKLVGIEIHNISSLSKHFVTILRRNETSQTIVGSLSPCCGRDRQLDSVLDSLALLMIHALIKCNTRTY